MYFLRDGKREEIETVKELANGERESTECKTESRRRRLLPLISRHERRSE